MNARVVTLLWALACSGHESTVGDPLRESLPRLRARISDIGESRASEVNADRHELQGVLSHLERRAAEIASARNESDSVRRSIERSERELDGRKQKAQQDRLALTAEVDNFATRLIAHNEDAKAQRAAAAAAVTPDQVKSANEWAERGKARGTLLTREQKELNARDEALTARENQVAADYIQNTIGRCWFEKHRARLDREEADALGECADAIARAIALKQIVHFPERRSEYESQRAITDKVAGDIFKGIGKSVGVKGLQTKAMVKLLSVAGLTGSGVGIAYTAADTFADIGIAGVDHRTKKVMNNLILIGDYGAVMKALIRAKGKSATQTPEYLAMRGQLERLAADMPANDREVLLQGLGSTAAIGAAITAAAAQYVSKGVGRAAGRITSRLNNADRATLGEGGVRFFRNALEVWGKVSASGMVKLSAKEITDARARVESDRSEVFLRPNPK